MIKLKCQIKGLDRLDKKINTIIKELPKTIEKSVEEILKETRTVAIRLEKGHHEDGILCEMVDVSNNTVKGRIYTDQKIMPWSWFEHFGTGQWAEMEHIGTTQHFLDSGYTQWFIPVSKVGRTLNYPIITINDNQFYVAHRCKS